eukprot:TRINITY_DN69543_c0_g1_i1.p1 TRINITY_DN69543_c0_g1~~TRINITY_DN69543_c0_g1_i1.p1  ORF type:complete len:534 (-),score=69.71 TRINITY_DN69543_c0_g1_i1:64-1473(-)
MLGDPRCWDSPQFTYVFCCEGGRGHAVDGGEPSCWDGEIFTYRRCCSAFSLTLGVRIEVRWDLALPLAWRRWDWLDVALRALTFLETINWENLRSGPRVFLLSDVLELRYVPSISVWPPVANVKPWEQRMPSSDVPESVAETLKLQHRSFLTEAIGAAAETDHRDGPYAGRLFMVLYETDDVLTRELAKVRRRGGRFFIPDHLGLLSAAGSKQAGTQTLPLVASPRNLVEASDEQERALRKRYLWGDRACVEALEQARLRYGELNLEWDHSRVSEHLCQALAATGELQGHYVEVGVLRGDSAAVVAAYLAETGISRPMTLFDTFSGFDYEEAADSFEVGWFGRDRLFATSADHISFVDRLLAPWVNGGRLLGGVHLHQRNVVRSGLGNAGIAKIAVAFVDVDLYEATAAALHHLAPLVAPGGLVLCEDAATAPYTGGALLAFQEFVASELGAAFVSVHLGQAYALVKAR